MSSLGQVRPRLDLYSSITRQRAHRKGGARRAMVAETGHVRGVHRLEVRDVGEEHRRLDDVTEICPLESECLRQVYECLLEFTLDTTFNDLSITETELT